MKHAADGHDDRCGPHRGDWRTRRAYWRMRGHLQRMIFVWFGVAILLAGLSVAALLTLSHAEHHPRWLFVVLAGIALWAVSGVIARRLVWPLRQVVGVAQDIGSGKLDSRVQLGRHRHGEVGVLADAINDMADRIEQQMADQRELLAGVSHEIRSPLTRLRVLLELGNERGVDARMLREMEQELLVVDSLVGELLASARLDFSAIETRSLDARDVARRALERAGIDDRLLDAPARPLPVEADPTLLARALGNLLDNARKHAGGARALRVRNEQAELAFEVEDAGPGFSDADLPRVFESFVRGERGGASSLGLGLSLVRRIAEAHGGRAWAENRDGGGARVGFSVARPA
jgi:signal transduction histidine kinase